MPTVNSGVRDTSHLDTESRRARDVRDAMLLLDPDAAPLVQILMSVERASASDPKFEWYEDELNPRFDKLTAALTAGATTMTVTNYAYFRAGDLVKINNAEVVYVSATPSTTSVTITRGIGSTGASAASVGDSLFIMSNAHEEGATNRALLTTQKVPKYNYCQIIRNPFGATVTEMNTKQFAGQTFNRDEQKKLVEQKRDIEQAIIFGERGKTTGSGGQPLRFCGGILEFLTTNVVDMGGTMTEAEFEDYLRRTHRHGSKDKIFFGSSKAMTVINGFGRDKLDTRSDESTYGVTMTQYKNAGRRLMLVEHVLFENDALTDLTGIAGYGVTVDMQNIRLRFNRTPFIGMLDNIQDNSADQRIDEYISEVGIEVNLEKTHGLATGIEG